MSDSKIEGVLEQKFVHERERVRERDNALQRKREQLSVRESQRVKQMERQREQDRERVFPSVIETKTVCVQVGVGEAEIFQSRSVFRRS